MRRIPSSGKHRRRRVVALWLAVRLLTCAAATATVAGPLHGDSESAPINDVEAAYLFNFAKFVRWPNSVAGSPLIICIAGTDSFRQAVAGLVNGEKIGGREVQVNRVVSNEAIADCSILFVEVTERTRLASFLDAAKGKPVLTVSDAPDFLVRGGIIQFVLESDHVRFAINLDAADRNNLSLSSQLLKVAIHVTGIPGKGDTR